MVVHRILLLGFEVSKLWMIHAYSLISSIWRRLNPMLIIELALQFFQRLNRSCEWVCLVTLYQRMLLIVVSNLQHIFWRHTNPTTLSKRVRLSVTSPGIHNIRRFYFELVIGLWLIEISLAMHFIAAFLLVSMAFNRGKILQAAVVEVKPWYYRVVEGSDPAQALSLRMIWSSNRVSHKVIYLERGGKFAITCTGMLLDHLIIWNLLVHLVLGSLSI